MRVFSLCFQLVFNIVTLQFFLHYFSTAYVDDDDDNDDNIYSNYTVSQKNRKLRSWFSTDTNRQWNKNKHE